ncbi:unnamed protein product [Pleuronectes platessa]|uniref:Uncharacterized protein n=1 Tax=Pleuronectes platessa TaxID=8262 RepID=A0A9N7YQS9_PLEPL|nr:unnamed protein product [Pleuronectes platessa]
MVTDEKKELSTKLAELKAELEELKRSREEDERGGEEKLLITNSPLKYLTLHDDELNSNIVHCHNKLLPSPEQHLLFCQSTNQLNMLVSQATADLMQEEPTVIDPERLPLSDEGPMGQVASDSEEYLAGSPLLDQRGELSHLPKSGSTSPDMEKEVNRLYKEKAKETQRAQQSQVKLEVLQTQVTRQTQQLTMAFEKQSQHISGLLAELQEKEGALLSQGEELQRYKQELQAFKAEKEVTKLRNDDQRKESRDESSMEITELQPYKKQDCSVISHTTQSLAGGDSTTQRDEDQTKTDAETPTLEGDRALSEQHPVSVDSDMTESYLDSACVMEETESSGGRVDVLSELLALRQENQLLKQRIEGVTMSETRNLALQTDSENQEDPVKQSHYTGDAALPCLTEQRPPTVKDNITPEGQESLLQNNENQTTLEEEELEEASCLEINLLEQKVVALQVKIQALSEETQQQTEELTLWRLASQPAPTIDQDLPNKDNQDQNSAVRQSQSQQLLTDEMTHIPPGTRSQAPTAQVQESNSNVTVIREDELFLSCSSNKLPGRMLFSRLQHSNLPEPKSFLQFKQTAALQEYNQDPDKESEKENIVHWSDTSPSQHKDKRDSELIQMSSEKTGQQVTKGPTKTKTAECPRENPVGKPNTSRTTSEINTTNGSSERSVRTDMKSVSSQTEESLCPQSAPTASELHCAYTQTEEKEEEEEQELVLVESPPASLIPSSEGLKSRDKMLFSGSFPIPSDPARLAERIRRNRTQLSAAF